MINWSKPLFVCEARVSWIMGIIPSCWEILRRSKRSLVFKSGFCKAALPKKTKKMGIIELLLNSPQVLSKAPLVCVLLHLLCNLTNWSMEVWTSGRLHHHHHHYHHQQPHHHHRNHHQLQHHNHHHFLAPSPIMRWPTGAWWTGPLTRLAQKPSMLGTLLGASKDTLTNSVHRMACHHVRHHREPHHHRCHCQWQLGVH